MYVTKYCIRKPVDIVFPHTSFFSQYEISAASFDDSVNEKRLFLTNENWRWHLLVELSYLFFEKARIKGHPLLFWIIYDFNHSKLTKIRAESTIVDHVWRVWRTLSRVFRPITAYFSFFLDLNSSIHRFRRSTIHRPLFLGFKTQVVASSDGHRRTWTVQVLLNSLSALSPAARIIEWQPCNWIDLDGNIDENMKWSINMQMTLVHLLRSNWILSVLTAKKGVLEIKSGFFVQKWR